MRKTIIWVVIVVCILYGIRSWHVANRSNYWQEQQRVQNEVIEPGHNNNDTQLGRDIADGRKKDDNKNEFTMTDIENDRDAVMPSADRSAKIDLIAKEWEARARGELLKVTARYMSAKQSTWFYTNIPILSCMYVTVHGKMTYGTYESGPDGINLDSMEDWNRHSFLTLNKDRKTLAPGIPWGTVLGCIDAKDETECARPFPLGRGVYLSPRQVGGGHLWTIPNGFVSSATDITLMTNIKKLNMSDYNAYEGGFQIDQKEAPPNMCEQTPTLVAQR